MGDMTGLENIFVGHYKNKGPFIDWKALRVGLPNLWSFEVQREFDIPVRC